MNTLSTRMHYVFRIACAMCFIGHGAFGIITKQVWCNYFAVFGIGQETAYQLMPAVGMMDILFGIAFIVYPMRSVALWLVIWGLFTALLRPLSGEPFAEFLERAGNYGAPLLLLLLAGTKGLHFSDWFRRIGPPQVVDDKQWKHISIALRVTAFTLLLGHGWLNLIGKQGLLNQYTSLGFENALQVARGVGAVEVAGALFILIRPLRQVVLILFVWKMASELFYPSWEIFEWVERGGSYGVLLALWMMLRERYVVGRGEVNGANPSYAATIQMN